MNKKVKIYKPEDVIVSVGGIKTTGSFQVLGNEQDQQIKTNIINTTIDLGVNFISYDRRNDEELSHHQLVSAIDRKVITVDEIVEIFRKSLINNLS